MKKILILLIPFLLTGCVSAQYNLKIDKDLMVNEEVNISATKEYFNSFYMDLPITIVKEAYNNEIIINKLKENGYFYTLKKDNKPFPSVFVQKKFNLFNDYSSNTIFNGQVFKNILVTQDKNIVTIKTDGFIPYSIDDSDGDVDRYAVSELIVNISLPYVVTSNNADKYKASTNTYSWIINEKTKDKEIKLTFDKTRIYVYNLVLYISIGIVLLLFIMGIFIILKLRRKNIKMNRL